MNWGWAFSFLKSFGKSTLWKCGGVEPIGSTIRVLQVLASLSFHLQ